MIRLKRKEMEEKLRLVMEFVSVPEEDKQRVNYEPAQKTVKNS